MDIHSFKIVNSICGVAKGDEALRWISENIRGVVGYNDISGHINADRFVIFFADDKINKVIRKIETINLQLIKVSESLKIPKIQPYFGVTKWEPGKKVEEAYGEANFAKNRIKERKDVQSLRYISPSMLQRPTSWSVQRDLSGGEEKIMRLFRHPNLYRF